MKGDADEWRTAGDGLWYESRMTMTILETIESN